MGVIPLAASDAAARAQRCYPSVAQLLLEMTNDWMLTAIAASANLVEVVAGVVIVDVKKALAIADVAGRADSFLFALRSGRACAFSLGLDCCHDCHLRYGATVKLAATCCHP